MKHSRLFLLMAAAGAAATGAGATSTTGTGPATAPDSNVAAADKPKRAPKNPDNKLDIINGRLPLPLVALIRFKETGTVAERAKKYGTSVGKVFDITKNKNFAYVDASYKPSADELAAAVAWCDTGKTFKGKSLKEAGGDPDAIKSALTSLGVATPEEVAARNWAVRTVGVKSPDGSGTAPVADGANPASTGGTAAQAAAAGAKPGAKLFP